MAKSVAIQRAYLPLILDLARGEAREIFILIVYAFGIGLCTLSIPIAVQSLVNSVAFGTVFQPIVVISILLTGVLLISGVLRVLQLVATEILQQRVIVRYALYIGRMLPHVIVDEFNRRFGPEYVLRFLEVFNVQKLISLLLLDGIALAMQLVIGLIIVSFYHPYFLAFALCTVVLIFIVTYLLGYGGVSSACSESSAKYDVVAWFQDLATVPTIFKSYAGERHALNRSDLLVSDYIEKRKKHFSILFRQNVGVIVVQILGNGALLLLGGKLVIDGKLTLGQLVSAEIIFSTVFSSITKLGKYIENFHDLCAGLDKLASLVQLPYESVGGDIHFESARGAQVTIENLTVSSETDNVLLLKNINLSIQSGEKMAIVGQGGSGKSVLAKLLYRLVTPTTGKVEVDGNLLSDIAPLDLRTSLEVIGDAEIFHGTILENISAGNRVERTVVRSVLKDLGVLSSIESLPEGLDTPLRGSWTPLSRAQVQLIMIARGIVAQSRLLVIDGTLDGLGDGVVEIVVATLKKLGANCTVVVLTKEVAIAALLDRVIHLEDGAIV